MHCRQRSALVNMYRHRVRALSEAVTALREPANASSNEHFMAQWKAVRSAAAACKSIKSNLCRHVAIHGCLFDALDTYETELQMAA
jgi:hypothetical protein